ncbi:hypothetical protein [Aequorivita xiaoshiensis]|uniref:Uncharacterized protein n=1 Tax=Aequorivita xiaoshiensis TaxID=2874476 RepID=A0A9X1UE09_9FLAO|nr:hypothetical protein [Aequorivita xiaoshiensis]MCG2432151.1 hypothetical protein [Aequorivita xiaoshiensis]
MTIKNSLNLKKGIVLAIGIGLFIFIFWNSHNHTKKYYQNTLNGIVEYKFQSRSGILVKFYNIEDYVDLEIGSSNMKFIEKGDSISKPAKSSELFLFKNDTTAEYPKYFYLENAEKYN